MALGGNVKVVITGAAPLAPHVEDFLRVVTCAPVVQGYGKRTILSTFILMILVLNSCIATLQQNIVIIPFKLPILHPYFTPFKLPNVFGKGVGFLYLYLF